MQSDHLTGQKRNSITLLEDQPQDEVYFMLRMGEDDYERVTNKQGVKTTVCKNRFEVICRERAEVNDMEAIAEFKAWLARRREDSMRDDGGVPGQVP